MATYIPEGFGSLAIEYTGTAGTSPYIVTCGVALPTGIALQEVVNFAYDTWVVAWESLTFSAFTFERAILTVNAPGGGYGSVESDVAPNPGGASGAPAPIGMAVLVSKRTSVLGRHGRGRFFIPGLLGEGDVDVDGLFDNSSRLLYQTTIDEWQLNMEAGGDGWGLGLNPYLLHGAVAPLPSQITSFSVSNKIGWIRKRLR